MLARRAAKLVRVSYRDLPAIITIEVRILLYAVFPPCMPKSNTQDAIEANSFFHETRRVGKGDFSSAYQDSPVTLEGQVRVGGQEHFYMEPNTCLVVPKGENGEMDIFASTQNLNGTRMMAASALGIPANRITTSTKRIGMHRLYTRLHSYKYIYDPL